RVGAGPPSVARAQGHIAARRWTADGGAAPQGGERLEEVGLAKRESVRKRPHGQRAGLHARISVRSGNARLGPKAARPRRKASRAIEASRASRINPGNWFGCSTTERRTATQSGIPLGRKLKSAAGGRSRWAGSMMTRQAANGKP